MSEVFKLSGNQLRFQELELRRYLLNRGCPRHHLATLLSKYSNLQLAADRMLLGDLPVLSIHRPDVKKVFTSPAPIAADSLEMLTGLLGIARKVGLNEQPVVLEKKLALKDQPLLKSNSDIDTRQNIMDWQMPVIDTLRGFTQVNPDSLFVVNAYSKAHVERGAVFLPAVNYCLGAIFRNAQGNISAMHMHKAEQPSIDDVSNLLTEHGEVFGNDMIRGGHLTMLGMEFPWEALNDAPDRKIPLLYRSPQLTTLCSEKGITYKRLPVGLDQKEIRVWQMYGTTNPEDPIVAKVDITKQEGFSMAIKGYSELMSELRRGDSEP